MSNGVIIIELPRLALAFVPVAVTLLVFLRWSLSVRNALWAVCRMLVQLLAIGYVLSWLFGANNGLLILLVLTMMVCASGWIALGPVKEHRRELLRNSVLAILVGGGVTLALVTQGVLALDPWYQPRYIIPLAGMAFANAMTAVSLAAERLYAELKHKLTWDEARQVAYQAAMIPVINSLFAVGLVSLPGMMTGQILSGVSPLIAVRYQVMVMCMIFAASGISTAIFLGLARARISPEPGAG